MQPKLTESVVVLDCQMNNVIVNEVWFAATDEDTPGKFTHRVCITVQDFIDMNAPDKITVTIEPGDKLNV